MKSPEQIRLFIAIMAEETCVISYVMLDDLRPIEPPIHRTIPKTKEFIMKFILEISNSYDRPYPVIRRIQYDRFGCAIKDEAYEKDRKEWEQKQAEKKSDPSYFFSGLLSEYCRVDSFSDEDADVVADSLLESGYWVRNRVEKYYVIAFALDGAKFHVYSKDCDPEVINWGEGAPKGEHHGPILTEEDNVNPVIAAVAAANAGLI